MSHNHPHAKTKTFNVAFAIATGLNVLIVALQIWYGLLSHSTALLADAAHNAGDVIGLILAWGAYTLAKRLPTGRFTYGMRSSTILAALLNAMLLLVATGGIVWEAAGRLFTPVPVDGQAVMVIAGAAIVLNGFSAWLLSRGSKGDLNIHSAFLHLLSDAAVSVGVVVAGFAIAKTGIVQIDSLASIVIALVIVWSTWRLFREALRLSLQAVPEGVDITEVRLYLCGIQGVERIHDLHVWPISTTETALTCHLVVKNSFDSGLLDTLSRELEHRFKIDHATIQLETPDGRSCRLAPSAVI